MHEEVQEQYPLSRLSLRMRSTTILCQSSLPWHMLRRATFMPCTASASSMASLQVAGPMVATIFVRLVLLKPAPHRDATVRYHVLPFSVICTYS